MDCESLYTRCSLILSPIGTASYTISTSQGQAILVLSPICFRLSTFSLFSLQVKPEELTARVAVLQAELRATNKEVEALRGQLSVAKAQVRVRVVPSLAVDMAALRWECETR